MVDRGPGIGIIDSKHDFKSFLEGWRPDSTRMASIFRPCDDLYCNLKSRCFEPERMVGRLARALVSWIHFLLSMA